MNAPRSFVGPPGRSLVPASAIARATGKTARRIAQLAAELAARGQARKVGGEWHVDPEAWICGHRARRFLAPEPALAGHRLPPGADAWADKDRRRFLDTHALLAAWRQWRTRGHAADELSAAAFALMPAADFDLPCELFSSGGPACGRSLPVGPVFNRSVRDWATDRGLSVAADALYRYAARIERDGNIDRRGCKGSVAVPAATSGAGVSPAISPEAWDLFRSLYLSPARHKIAACYRFVAGEAAARGWCWPSLRTIQLEVQRRLAKPELTLAREGERAHEARCVPKIERDIDDIAAGEWWALDGRTLDQFVRVPDARREWRAVRPTVTGVLDVRSRKLVLDVRITECADGILAGIKDGLRQWGAPLHVICDNGEAYKAAAGTPRGTRRQRDYWADARIGSVFAQLGVEVHNSIPYHAWAKPIESVWRKVKDGLDRWCWSFCGGTHDEKPEGHARELKRRIDDLPTIDELRQQIATWLAEYHATEQSGRGTRGLCPDLVFEQYRGTVRVVDERVIALTAALKRGPVTVGRDGVRYMHIRYGATQPEVWKLQGRPVWLLIDPERADQVTLADEQGRALCIATNERLRGTTQEDRRAAARIQARFRRLSRDAAEARDYLRETPTEQILATKRRHAEARKAVAQASLPAAPEPARQLVRPDLVESARAAEAAARRDAARRAKGPSSGNQSAFDLLSSGPTAPPRKSAAELLTEMVRAG